MSFREVARYENMNIQQFTNPQFWTVCSQLGGYYYQYHYWPQLAVCYFWSRPSLGPRSWFGSWSWYLSWCSFSQFLRSHDYFMADQSSHYLWGCALVVIFSLRFSWFKNVWVSDQNSLRQWGGGKRRWCRPTMSGAVAYMSHKIGALVAIQEAEPFRIYFHRNSSRCRNFRRIAD